MSNLKKHATEVKAVRSMAALADETRAARELADIKEQAKAVQGGFYEAFLKEARRAPVDSAEQWEKFWSEVKLEVKMNGGKVIGSASTAASTIKGCLTHGIPVSGTKDSYGTLRDRLAAVQKGAPLKEAVSEPKENLRALARKYAPRHQSVNAGNNRAMPPAIAHALAELQAAMDGAPEKAVVAALAKATASVNANKKQ